MKRKKFTMDSKCLIGDAKKMRDFIYSSMYENLCQEIFDECVDKSVAVLFRTDEYRDENGVDMHFQISAIFLEVKLS